MAFSRRFVQCLRLQQLPSHLDLQVLFDTMQLTPSQLAISYNPRGVGMNYSSNASGMRLSDCRMLARALAHTGMVQDAAGVGCADTQLHWQQC